MFSPKILLAGASLTAAAAAFANTTILLNADFSNGTEEWGVVSNKFVGGAWQATVGSWEGGAYAASDFITVQGDGHVFTSWDDGTSDMIEHFLVQEWNAGPTTGTWPTEFETGDVLVFKGSASATKSASSVKARAFIKTLGYNSQGWEFQVKEAYSDFLVLTDQLQSFELTMTYPDITQDDSLQVIQMGLELTTEYNGSAMESGSIYFENLEGYIEGDVVVNPDTWRGYTPDSEGWVLTDGKLGWVNVNRSPWIFSLGLNKYIYLPDASPLSAETTSTGWVYVP
jgi:hypothetical protein